MHDLLFEERILASQEKRPANFSSAKLIELVSKIGLDSKEFNACLSSPEAKQTVDEDYAQAKKLFPQLGTPTFIINCNEYGGAYPYENFKKIIEDELSKQPAC